MLLDPILFIIKTKAAEQCERRSSCRGLVGEIFMEWFGSILHSQRILKIFHSSICWKVNLSYGNSRHCNRLGEGQWGWQGEELEQVESWVSELSIPSQHSGSAWWWLCPSSTFLVEDPHSLLSHTLCPGWLKAPSFRLSFMPPEFQTGSNYSRRYEATSLDCNHHHLPKMS